MRQKKNEKETGRMGGREREVVRDRRAERKGERQVER